MADIPDEPKKSASDVAYGMAKAAVSSVPVAGAAAAELLALIFGPPIEKRRQRWVEQLAEAIKELQEKMADLTSEKLSENEAFVTTALHATEIAVRTHQEEKLEALRNAVISAALPDAPDDTLQQIFLNYVDSLTPWHLRVLMFFDDPRDWGESHGIVYPTWAMGSPARVLEQSMPELAGQGTFYNQLVSDLEQRGLLAGGGIHTTMTAQGMFSSRTTPLGRQFLQFISRE
jgi:hypothetical protein